jgi:RNA polymerase primary sigma factor
MDGQEGGGGVALLSAEGERALVAAAQAGDREATGRLVEAFEPLVGKVVALYKGRGMPWDDLAQEARLGLLEAIPGFDPTKGRFATYASWRMRGRITRAFGSQGRLAKLSQYKAEQVRKARTILRLGGEAVDVALVLEVSEEVAQDVLEEAFRETSRLDAPRRYYDDGDAMTGYELIPEGDLTPFPSRQAGDRAASVLRPYVARLDSLEGQVLTLRYGLADEGALTLKQVGERLGLSLQEVWAVERRATRHLRALSKNSFLHTAPGNNETAEVESQARSRISSS